MSCGTADLEGRPRFLGRGESSLATILLATPGWDGLSSLSLRLGGSPRGLPVEVTAVPVCEVWELFAGGRPRLFPAGFDVALLTATIFGLGAVLGGRPRGFGAVAELAEILGGRPMRFGAADAGFLAVEALGGRPRGFSEVAEAVIAVDALAGRPRLRGTVSVVMVLGPRAALDARPATFA